MMFTDGRLPSQMHRLVTTWLVLLLAATTLPSGALAQEAAANAAVRDVRVWPGSDATRVVFELSSGAQYTVLTLRDPDRVVIDFSSARLEMGDRPLPAGEGLIKRLRAATNGAGLRVVLDVASPVDPHSFLVAPRAEQGHRMVLDLVPGKSEAPSAPPVVKSTPSVSGRDIVVAIDAGHGGTDPGASGSASTREKDVTLAIARRLKQVIDAEPGMRAVLTRDGDYFLAHRVRIKRAREQQAHMFVSVHADAYRDRTVAGSSVYVLSARGASDEAARWLAERENAADLVGGVSLQDKDAVLASVLLDLSQGASMSASLDAAEKVLHELYRIGNVKRASVQQAGFLVLKSPDIPSMLVETAFITNPDEEARLNDPGHQQQLAHAIHAGVRAYFQANPPPGTRFAQLRQQREADRLAAAPAGGVAVTINPR
jgi:N-acetylmuramoyl-L-alanine amidase